MRARPESASLPPVENNRTRATTVLGGQKRHSHKPLELRFCHDGFDYRRIARKGQAAIYEQSHMGRVLAYEVIRIRRRDGFSIQGKYIEPAEVYPRSEAWGMDGWTVRDKDAAFDKLREVAG